MSAYRPATESETQDYLAGRVSFAASRETEHGLEIMIDEVGEILDTFMLWLRENGWIPEILHDQAIDITVTDFLYDLHNKEI